MLSGLYDGHRVASAWLGEVFDVWEESSFLQAALSLAQGTAQALSLVALGSTRWEDIWTLVSRWLSKEWTSFGRFETRPESLSCAFLAGIVASRCVFNLHTARRLLRWCLESFPGCFSCGSAWISCVILLWPQFCDLAKLCALQPLQLNAAQLQIELTLLPAFKVLSIYWPYLTRTLAAKFKN